MKKVLSSVFLGALMAGGSAVIAAGSDADPAVGTWKLNLARSTFAVTSPGGLLLADNYSWRIFSEHCLEYIPLKQKSSSAS